MRVMILAALMIAAPLEGQNLATRIAGAREGRITFTFEAKEGVCGDGENLNIGSIRRSNRRDWNCEEGPVRVTVERAGAQVLRLKTTVGGVIPENALDLGNVPTAEAADWLLDLAEAGNGRVSSDAIMPAAIARDAVIWPRLAAMAKRSALREETRKQAIFWLGQQAADVAIGPLEEVLTDDPDREIKQAALFALTQQRTERSIQILIRTARTHRDPELRRSAFFWLGQSEDPRGIALFEEVLAGR